MPELFALLNLPAPHPVRRKISGKMGLTMALGDPKGKHQGTRLHCGPLKQKPGILEDRIWVEPSKPNTISIQCADLANMLDFYREVVGLVRVSGSIGAGQVILKNPDGFCGHMNLLVLHAMPTHRQPTAISKQNHLTLSLSYAKQETALDWLDHLEHPYQIDCLSWVGWCSVLLNDPEGNSVELVSIGSSF